MAMNCKEVWREVSNYLDREVSEQLRIRMQIHFEHCRHCRAVLNGTRNVVQLLGDIKAFELPAGSSNRLRKKLARKLARASSSIECRYSVMRAEEETNHQTPMETLRFRRIAAEEQLVRASAFYQAMSTRRTVRSFSPEPVPLQLIELAIRAAATAPSGANQQPWRFVVVSNPEVKRRIREAAEVEEKDFYLRRAPREWLAALQPLGTDWQKPFLEIAPYLIAVFRLDYGLHRDVDGQEIKVKHYYVMESVGIAVGLLLSSLHMAGLTTLTHTPSPMGFLCQILKRPKNERPYLLIPVGYPAAGAMVPRIQKKPLSEVLNVVA
jgi:iodotyrosine deiodinase